MGLELSHSLRLRNFLLALPLLLPFLLLAVDTAVCDIERPEPLVLDEPSEFILPHCLFLVDPTGSLSAQEVLTAPQLSRFRSYNLHREGLDFSGVTTWLLLEVEAPQNQAFSRRAPWFLDLTRLATVVVQVWEVAEGAPLMGGGISLKSELGSGSTFDSYGECS